ncbi:hypothetical protein [Plantactinospora sonchi]|uniref:Uncharacterized protein n=1 Tax=Plantactinospora sonchi TaxID=1544735 RepID=A0ABU7RNN9_9ACTN
MAEQQVLADRVEHLERGQELVLFDPTRPGPALRQHQQQVLGTGPDPFGGVPIVAPDPVGQFPAEPPDLPHQLDHVLRVAPVPGLQVDQRLSEFDRVRTGRAVRRRRQRGGDQGTGPGDRGPAGPVRRVLAGGHGEGQFRGGGAG